MAHHYMDIPDIQGILQHQTVNCQYVARMKSVHKQFLEKNTTRESIIIQFNPWNY